MRNKLLTILAMSCLTACGTTDVVNGNAMYAPINRDEARIIVERDTSLLYLGAAADVEINGKQVASLGRGGKVIHDVQAGESKVRASTFGAFGSFSVRFDAKAGETYQFDLRPKTDALILGSAFGVVGDAVNAEIDDTSGYFELELKNNQ